MYDASALLIEDNSINKEASKEQSILSQLENFSIDIAEFIKTENPNEEKLTDLFSEAVFAATVVYDGLESAGAKRKALAELKPFLKDLTDALSAL